MSGLGAQSRARPSVARGMAAIAAVATLFVVGRLLVAESGLGTGGSDPSHTEPACDDPIELSDTHGRRLGCASDAVVVSCGPAVVGDRVVLTPEGCRLESQGMSASTRWMLGLPLALNRIGAADLTLLPGIGPKLAAAIVDDRSLHGPFHAVDELERVSGIGPATVEKLRPLLSVTASAVQAE